MVRVDQYTVEEAIHVVDGALEELFKHDLEVLNRQRKILIWIPHQLLIHHRLITKRVLVLVDLRDSLRSLILVTLQ